MSHGAIYLKSNTQLEARRTEGRGRRLVRGWGSWMGQWAPPHQL